MSQTLDRAYNPQAVQDEVQELWDEQRAFHAVPDPQQKPYVIVIPPPNVTAALHMGHALNNTLQDVLVRYHRMLGENAAWIPGTDHAGIATQTVVDKRLQAEGQPALKDYKKLEAEGRNGREQFIEKVQAWKDEYERRITDQLKRTGSSCDYERQRFTMDAVCAAAVREAFFRLFRDGLIYRGKRLVNWDPVTQTALADDEVEMRQVDGHFWYMRYPILNDDGTDSGEYATVATTRPETMLGDTAVAVNPDDPDRARFIGRRVRLPIVNRVLPVVGDDYVIPPDPESDDPMRRYASGFLKVTPAHDPNDYAIGERHRETIEQTVGHVLINVMAPDGSISKDHGWPAEEFEQQRVHEFCHDLIGMDRYEAREAIVDWFREQGLLADVRPYSHNVGHSYRSHVPVEPYLSDQWYVKVTDDRLAGAALRAMTPSQRSSSEGCVWKEGDPFKPAEAEERKPGERAGDRDWAGKLNFFPERYAKTFQSWHENIRDWCISRQLWWGHRIPVWTYKGSETLQDSLRNVDLPSGDESALGDVVDFDQFDLDAFGALHDLQKKYPDEIAVAGFPGDQIVAEQYVTASSNLAAMTFVCVRADRPEIRDHLERVGYVQDPNVLDTWFSSALWPFSTLGWPDPEKWRDGTPDGSPAIPEGKTALEHWNPSSTLCTAREIITLWVSRMVMFNVYFRGRLPFYDVFIHAMIQDGEGQKMSKSLGNGVDPLDIVHSHGADAMRLTLAAKTTQTQDVRLPVDVVCPHTGEVFQPKTITTSAGYRVAAPVQACPSDPSKKMVTSFGVASGEAQPTDDMPLARNTSSQFDYGRNFANKLWNAARFVLATLEDAGIEPAAEPSSTTPDRDFKQRPLADRWVLSRLASTWQRATEALDSYRFNDYAQSLYDFFWHDFCDWYVEAVKPLVRNNDEAGDAARRTLATCLDAALRLLHPVMPYVTEKLWQRLNEVVPDRRLVAGIELAPSELCLAARWPVLVAEHLHDPEVERHFTLVREAVGEIRNIRSQYGVPPKQTLTARIKAEATTADRLRAATGIIQTLAGCEIAAIGPDTEPSADSATAVVGQLELYVEGLIDAEAERQRLDKRRQELSKSRDALAGRLNNPGYVEKAPEHLVQQTRDQLQEVERELETVEQKLAALAGQ